MRTVITAAIAAASFALVPSQADEEFTFNFEMHPPTTLAQAQDTYERLWSEAWRACGSPQARPTLQYRNERKACAEDLVEKVVAEADNAMLTTYYKGELQNFARL